MTPGERRSHLRTESYLGLEISLAKQRDVLYCDLVFAPEASTLPDARHPAIHLCHLIMDERCQKRNVGMFVQQHRRKCRKVGVVKAKAVVFDALGEPGAKEQDRGIDLFPGAEVIIKAYEGCGAEDGPGLMVRHDVLTAVTLPCGFDLLEREIQRVLADTPDVCQGAPFFSFVFSSFHLIDTFLYGFEFVTHIVMPPLEQRRLRSQRNGVW